jgi:hypothetical protein
LSSAWSIDRRTTSQKSVDQEFLIALESWD